VRELRFLARAHRGAKGFDAAKRVIDAALALAPGDPGLIYDRGEVKAHEGDAQGALADWQRAHELDPGKACAG
jgi:regulator of sirC expression with transglutaminase-like and TPR domain